MLHELSIVWYPIPDQDREHHHTDAQEAELWNREHYGHHGQQGYTDHNESMLDDDPSEHHNSSHNETHSEQENMMMVHLSATSPINFCSFWFTTIVSMGVVFITVGP